METIADLQTYLSSRSHGPLTVSDSLVGLLAACWSQFDGSGSEGMRADKLGRVETADWHFPVLSLIIERHGGMKYGSTRGRIQRWRLDLSRQSASCEEVGYRQLKPRATPQIVEPLAVEVARMICAGDHDPMLKWISNTKVKVLIANIIPHKGFNSTIAGRRKRFRAALSRKLRGTSWREFSPYIYVQQ